MTRRLSSNQLVGDFPDADVLTGKDRAEVYLASTEAQSAALRDGDGAVVEGIGRMDRWQERIILIAIPLDAEPLPMAPA